MRFRNERESRERKTENSAVRDFGSTAEDDIRCYIKTVNDSVKRILVDHFGTVGAGQ